MVRKTENSDFWEQNHFVNERGHRRKARLLKANRMETVSQLTTYYNSDMQKNISEHSTRQTSKSLATAADDQ